MTGYALAHPENKEELDFMNKMAKKNGSAPFWIGLKFKPKSNNLWHW